MCRTVGKPRVLVLCGHYLPGSKAGGPIRSVAGVVAALGGELDFRIVTSDREPGDAHSYPGVELGAWNEVGLARVWYARTQGRPHPLALARLVRSVRPELYWINSFLYPPLSIQPMLLMRAGILPKCPVILAPRGEFARGARALKASKKAAFLRFAKLSRVYDDVTWQASSEHEASDIRSAIGEHARIAIACDIPAPIEGGDAPRPEKRVGSLRIACLARIDRMKNVDVAIRLVSRLRGDVQLDVIGPPSEPEYFEECKALAVSLSARVSFLGEVPHDEVSKRLEGYHAMLLPTRGENFCHAVFESLSAGCPVVVSDRTPWRDLSATGGGWDLPLEDDGRWLTVLQGLVEMPPAEYDRACRAARVLGASRANSPALVEQNRRMFLAAL